MGGGFGRGQSPPPSPLPVFRSARREATTLSDILVGCGQITWVRFTPKGSERLAPEQQVLAEIAQAGYAGAPAGPEGNRSAQETIELYSRYRLRPAPGYVG